jgi:uncharacterized membrane protein
MDWLLSILILAVPSGVVAAILVGVWLADRRNLGK